MNATISPALRPGTQHCGCGACLAFFRSDAAFQKHRKDGKDGVRRCRTPAEMRAAGMSQNAAGYWITAAYKGPR